jgi:hypothetical protein
VKIGIERHSRPGTPSCPVARDATGSAREPT